MNDLANEPLDEKLSEFFKSEFPKPFPAAPRVIMPVRMARGASPKVARFALAASLLILACLAIFWPKNINNNNSSLRNGPASASDDKRHQLRFLNSKELPKNISPTSSK